MVRDNSRFAEAKIFANELIGSFGLRRAAEICRCSTETMARLAAGLDVREGSLALVHEARRARMNAAEIAAGKRDV